MRLDQSSWPEVEAYLTTSTGIILPTGSIEQHGPMGLIGTDIFCAEAISNRAAELTSGCVAPGLSYAPAPFNTAFPGTVSITADLFRELAAQVMLGLHAQGFSRIYILNGHGANLDPLEAAMKTLPPGAVRLTSWWNFDAVNAARKRYFGDWEGMHGTPSEISITQATHRVLSSEVAAAPPANFHRNTSTPIRAIGTVLQVSTAQSFPTAV